MLRGSGNVYRALGLDNAEVKQLKALLVADIIKTLKREHESVRRAHSRIGAAATDLYRIRRPDLGRFHRRPPDGNINRLGSWAEVW